MTSTEKKRDEKIDCIKGIMMLLTIIGHHWHLHGIFTVLGSFQKFCYFFTMPIFFICSCLFVKEFSWANFGRRVKGLLIPYVFWFFVLSYNYIFKWKNITDFKCFKLYLKGIVSGNWTHLYHSPLWFIPAVFMLNLFVSLCYKNKYFKIFILIVSALDICFVTYIRKHFHTQVPWGIDTILYILPLALIIAHIYHNHLKTKGHFVPLKYLIPTFIITIPILYVLNPIVPSILHQRIDFSQLLLPDLTNAMGGGIIVFNMFLYSLFELLYRLKNIKLFEYIGKYSLLIFILHMSVYKMIKPYVLKILLLPIGKDVAFFLILLIDIIVCIVFPILLQKILYRISDKFVYIGAKK